MTSAFNLDCLPEMRKFPDKHFDLAVVDPPYFSGPEKRKCYGKKISATGIQRVDYPISDTWIVPSSEYFQELERISKKYIVFGCNYYDYIFAPGRIVWDKCNGSSSFSDCEIAATNCHDSVRMFRYMWNGMCQGKSITEGHIMQGNKKKNEVRIHPTQKPVDLYRWILMKYAHTGDLILDTHLGSGSSRIAAYELGLDFTGYELDTEMFIRQEKRFREYTSQCKMEGV